MITDAVLALASFLFFILLCVLTLLAVAHWHARPVVVVEDPPPYEDEAGPPDAGHLTASDMALINAATTARNPEFAVEYEPDPILAVDPPVDRPYLPPQVPDGMVLYFGGAVHPDCAARWLRFDLRPIDGCAVWLTDSLKETVT